ncbi:MULTISPECIES: hypothetical protein [Acinetobacter calcoaceticus/baumannii complex]|uniref:hypothetical protein n=1 Tax=Acinetobacter calcoaceticus/baumannii complex TaxID=909768 RepID=UPI0002E2CCD8|nr:MULTISPECIES: hypothetical protein [Acinetobacter calcoaceticus/baumannii complex]EHU3264836.1 hypothetical protein [Acinetobacter baumannii]EIB7122433.1 hypothetical protein [Acinetobacter baumannii]KCX14703.1 hypothetical protein J723_3104 [Acinetobacter sp. 1264765]KRI89673.1 hypothetical protein APC70_10680 [Acinetobacter baumannii]NDW25831.1 hypothetical protein [Acinetobacter baumannii]
MKILNKVEAKLAWANGELLLVNNTERNGWEPFNPYDFGFDVFDKFEFQLKPRTIFIGEFEVPEPLRVAPEKGSTCSYPSPTVELGVQQFKWNGSKGQLRMLQHGQVHSSFDNAFAHCCAIIKISGGEFAEDILKLLNKPTEEVEEEKPSENDVEKAQTTEPAIESETTDPEYQKKLDTLLQRVKDSKTPDEVNAVYRYTRTWSDKQMEPLLLATHKRLEELEKSKAQATEPPSLMVQIQNAPDLTTLDALEIDVAARDPQIQSRLMDFVKKRRYELENPAVSQPEADPDYLLVDGF